MRSICVGYMQILCYSILYKGLEHAWFWYLWRRPEINALKILKDDCVLFFFLMCVFWQFEKYENHSNLLGHAKTGSGPQAIVCKSLIQMKQDSPQIDHH